MLNMTRATGCAGLVLGDKQHSQAAQATSETLYLYKKIPFILPFP